jgi:DNA-binding XRE family transcriptional regulator
MDMTGDQLQETREAVGFRRTTLAAFWQCSEGTIRQMETGKRHIPPKLAAWLRSLARWHETHPAPDGWRTRPDLAP